MTHDALFDRLLRERIIFLGTPIDDRAAHEVIAKLLFLEEEDPERDAILYLNSPGGLATAALAVLDTMDSVRMDVATVCVGQCAAAAALLLASGERGKRYAVPNARLMLGPLHGGVPSPGADLDLQVQAREILRLTQVFHEAFARTTGRSVTEIADAMQADTFFTAEEAVRFGLIDEVWHKRTGPDGHR